MELNEYITKRNKMLDDYSKLMNISSELGNESVKNDIDSSMKQLKKDCFKIVVVGEFSRGKSTFINAMMGTRLLPAKTNPTTTIINRISYGEEAMFILHFRDTDKTKEITDEEFKAITAIDIDDDDDALTAYEKQIEQLGNISYAEIKYPIELCSDGIEIIDTPGTNDLDQFREEITFKFIPEADAAIMLLSAEQILAKSELDFLKERIMKNDVQKVFFVINFKDRLEDPDDEPRICDIARKQLKEFIANPKIYMVSSRDALKKRLHDSGKSVKGYIPESIEETGFVMMESALSEYLIKEKANIKLERHKNRIRGLSERLINTSIAERKNALGCTVLELTKQANDMKPRLNRAREESHVVCDRLKTSLSLAVSDFTDEYRRGLERVARQAVMEVYNYKGELSGEAVARSLESFMAPIQNENEQRINEVINNRINREFNNASEKLRKIFKVENLSKERSLVISNNQPSMVPAKIDINYVDEGDTAIIGGGMLLGGLILAVNAPFIAIPAAIFGGQFFLQQFQRYKRADFLSKVATQIKTRYESIIPDQANAFQRKLDSRFEAIIDNIEKIIDNHICDIQNRLDKIIQEKNQLVLDDKKEADRLNRLEYDIKLLAGI